MVDTTRSCGATTYSVIGRCGRDRGHDGPHRSTGETFEATWIDNPPPNPPRLCEPMVPWAATVVGPAVVRGCSWVDCQVAGEHEHPTEFRWVNPGDPQAGEVHVHPGDDGVVTVSEAALAQLLTDAGWERA